MKLSLTNPFLLKYKTIIVRIAAKASEEIVAIATPLTSKKAYLTKIISKATLIIPEAIKIYSGFLLSPNALKITEVFLYHLYFLKQLQQSYRA